MTELELRAYLQGTDFTRQDFADRAENFLVEAGAGAGKTTIMVERIVNQLVSGYCQPEEIVAITFTNKSTLELRQRLDELLIKRRDALKEKASLTTQEQETLERLEYLIRESGRMQVSTIHSFCRTMLEAMPFASPLGLDMELLEDEEEQATAFLRRRMREDYQLFRPVRNMGMGPWVLEKFFLDRCNNNEAKTLYCTDQQKLDQWLKKDIPAAAIVFHKKLRDIATAYSKEVQKAFHLHYVVKAAMDADPVAFAADEKLQLKLAWQCLWGGDHCVLQSGLVSYQKRDFRQKPLGEALEALWNSDEATALRKAAAPLVHSYVMQDLVPLLAEYRAEKLKKHQATFNDLLLRARDMLRDDQEARQYFHQRYKVVYVDEMQDTDPVQTELLFYLTTDEKYFNAQDWKQCRPIPGSLFLVGDPKQAIYRFRGADIGVYNILLNLFQSEEDLEKNGPDAKTVGRKVNLRFNFRSSTEICNLSDQVFRPASPAQPHHFVGGDYHAEYVAMDAKAGSCPLSVLGWYYPEEQRSSMDPQRVAAFIRTMIDQKVEVGIHDPAHNKERHAAQPRDFLVLTKGKTTPQSYAEALQAVGIAADVSGEKGFKHTSPQESLTIFERLALHLRSLLSPRDDRLVLRILKECYQVRYTTEKTVKDQDGNDTTITVAEHKEEQLVHTLLLRTAKTLPGSRDGKENLSLTGLLYPRTLAGIRLALENEAQPDKYLLKLCDALAELASLRQLVKEKPAMAVIEHLLEGGYGIWSEQELWDSYTRRQQYAAIQQYLNLLRQHKERSFPALAAYAIECVEKTYEHDLALEPADNVVRIMNLHKAKGLEAEVVILAYSSYKDRSPQIHVERKADCVEESVALHPKKGAYDTDYAVGWPEDWLTTHCPEEKKYADAEYARLLYVAATRAKTMLVVYGLPEQVRQQRAAQAAAQAAANGQPAPAQDKEEKLSYWQPLVEKLPPLSAAGGRLADAYQALMSGEVDQNIMSTDVFMDITPPTGSSVVQPEEKEAKLQDLAEELADSAYFAITPSRLDKHARVEKKQESDADPDQAPAQQALAAPQSEAEDEAAWKPKDDENTVSAEDAAEEAGPCGSAWGTMIHRVMELAVRDGSYAEKALCRFARQAVQEALNEELFDKKQREYLGLALEDEGETIFDKLVPEILKATAFVKEADSSLRRLLEGAAAYPEMPFFLQAKEDLETIEIYQHLFAHLGEKEAEKAKDRTLAVEGIIDLAVLRDDGWYVVDYKTDRVRSGESDDAFAQRLKEEYSAQITAYARVLERMTGRSHPVKKGWLCSIPLGGKFIELDICK